MFWVFIVCHGVWGVILGILYGWWDDMLHVLMRRLQWRSWDTLKWWLSERGGGFHQTLWCTASLPAFQCSFLCSTLMFFSIYSTLLSTTTVGVSIGSAPQWPCYPVGFIQCILFRNSIFWVSLCFFTLSIMLNRAETRDHKFHHSITVLVTFYELVVYNLTVRESQKAAICLSTGILHPSLGLRHSTFIKPYEQMHMVIT